jgi:hypothetical protein
MMNLNPREFSEITNSYERQNHEGESMKNFYYSTLLLVSFLPLLMASSCGEEIKPATLAVLPEAPSVVVGSPAIKLTATVENSSATVLWALSGSGSLNVAKGLSVEYTPPATLPTPPTVELTATLEGTNVSDKATITLLERTAPTPAITKLYVKADTGLDTNTGTEDKPFKTITKALSVAVAGQTVVPRLGESRAFSTITGESFPLRLKSGVSLEPERRVVIGGPGNCLLLKNVQKVRLTNLALNCASGVAVEDSSEIVLSSIIATSQANGFGISVESSQVSLDNVEASYFLAGLRSRGSSQITVTNSKFTLNEIGAEFGGESNVTADANTFSENKSSGILVLEGASLTLKNSTLSKNGSATDPGYGLVLNSERDSSLTIDASTFDGHTGSGVNLQSGFGAASNFSDVTITNSTFSTNNYGLQVGNAEGVIELRKNTFAFNTASNTTYQISDQRPNSVGSLLVALETTIDDGMGLYQLSGTKPGPDSDGNVWEISGTTSICFSGCP